MIMEEKRLFLLDAYALIYRAYYALIRAPRVTSKGFNTSAIFGFCNTLDEILRKENPTHIAVCFDPSGPTFRHEEYPEYKAQRDKQPEDITASIPYIKRILEAYNIPVIEREGYEADDVIGTLSRMAEREGFTTYMMTPDKDYGQLVTDRVFMYRPSLRGEGFEVRGPREVCERYGIERPEQVIDLLALEGDASDNIPGCPGVGEKTAVKLIAQFGSVEKLIAGVDELKGALRKKIEANAKLIEFSKRLVTICTEVPLGGISPSQLLRRPEDTGKLIEVFRELEFRTFIKRITGTEQQPSPAAKSNSSQGSLFDEAVNPAEPMPEASVLTDLGSYPHDFKTVETVAEVAEAVAEAARCAKVGVAVAADGYEQPMTAVLRGIAFSAGDRRAFYLPLGPDNAEREALIAALQPLFAEGEPAIVSGDVKTTMLLMRRAGLRAETDYLDVSVAHYLIDPEMKHTLPVLAARYLDYEMLPAPAARGKQPAAAYSPDGACEAAEVALRLMPLLLKQIDDNGLRKLLDDIELPLIRVLADMEWTGVRVDVGELRNLSEAYTRRLKDMESKAYELAGGAFNIGSPMQVGEVLFERLQIDPSAKRTKKGAYSTTEEILEKYRGSHPIVGLILEIRALKKLLATYIDALPALVNPRTGRIHTTFNQTVTATGRISSANPNMQNIPVRSDDGKEIRRAFIPAPGRIMLSADYSQIELRLMANLSGDPSMVEAFLSGADFHRATAAKIYHVPLEEVTDSQRRSAKTANFGIIYGISAFGLSERLGIPRAESKELIVNYFKTYPGVKRYMDGSIEHAREKGYVATVMGRRRILSDINSRNAVVRSYAERNAINAPLQGSAADIIKLAMVRIYRRMAEKGMRSAMILQVHDELIFDVVPEELAELSVIVEECMTGAYDGKVPLEVSAGTGRNWLEAH